jgi:hypothetical protein
MGSRVANACSRLAGGASYSAMAPWNILAHGDAAAGAGCECRRAVAGVAAGETNDGDEAYDERYQKSREMMGLRSGEHACTARLLAI